MKCMIQGPMERWESWTAGNPERAPRGGGSLRVAKGLLPFSSHRQLPRMLLAVCCHASKWSVLSIVGKAHIAGSRYGIRCNLFFFLDQRAVYCTVVDYLASLKWSWWRDEGMEG
jgi:hypothetical protein